MENVDELFSETYGVALRYVDDAVEGVGDDKDRESTVGKLHVGRNFFENLVVDIASECYCRRQRCEALSLIHI